jgi:hypothetical protein
MLEQIVNWLAYGSLGIGAIAAYLHLNKIWPRKHIPEVACVGHLAENHSHWVCGVSP